MQSGLPPVPKRTFSRSMLLPVLQLVLLWWTPDLIECHGRVRGMVCPFVGPLLTPTCSNTFLSVARDSDTMTSELLVFVVITGGLLV